MKVKVGFKRYEMAFGQGVKCEMLKLWFPKRRLLRALKRSIMRLGPWLVALCLFVPMAIPMLFLMWKTKMTDENNMVSELVFLFLGSVLLVILKELVDGERARHNLLLQQYALYSMFHAKCNEGLMEMAESLGMSVSMGGQRVFQSYQSVANFTSSIKYLQPSEMDVRHIFSACESLKAALRDVRSALLGKAFVDCAFTDKVASTFSRAESELEHILRLADDHDPARIVCVLTPLAWDLYYICDLMRTPWRYANDQARRQILQRYIEKNGIKIMP